MRPLWSDVRLIFVSREDMKVDGITLCAQIARLFDDVGEFSMFKINLSYFPSKARLNFRWIFQRV